MTEVYYYPTDGGYDRIYAHGLMVYAYVYGLQISLIF